MIQHLEAILIIMKQLVIWAFYAAYAVAGVIMAISFVLELLHRLLDWITGGER